MQRQPSYAVIDLETTGFGPNDRIIEIGVVLLDHNCEVQKTWETLVQPHRDVPNTFVHHLSASDLVDAPGFSEVAGELATLLHGRTLVAHNASFEVRFLTREFGRLGVAFPSFGTWVLDTMAVFGQAFPHNKRSLSEAMRVTGNSNERPHTALADAMATADLLAHLSALDSGIAFRGTPLKLPAFEYSEGRPVRPRGHAESQAEDGNEWLSRLANNLPAAGAGNAEKYKTVLRAALADKKLVKSELKQLEEQAIQDGIPHSDLLLIHEEFVRQLAIEAWLDGIVTDEERNTLRILGTQLGLPQDFVDELLSSPQAGDYEIKLVLEPGDRITFTGQMDLPREEWEDRARALGFDVGGVTKKSKVLVSSNPDSQSGKAKKARDFSVPIIGEKEFAQLINAFTSEMNVSEPTLSVAQAQIEERETASILGALFPWLGTLTNNPMEIAQLWVRNHPSVALAEMSPVLQPSTKPEIDETSSVELRWLTLHPEPLAVTVADLKDLQGVGEYRLLSLVEKAVLSAFDSDLDRLVPSPMGIVSDFYGDDDTYEDSELLGDSITEVNPISHDEFLLFAGWAELARGGVEKREPSATLKENTASLQEVLDSQDPVRFLFNKAVGQLIDAAQEDERKLAIISQRLLGEQTLDELGSTFGVTRERIRQLERALVQEFNAHRDLFDEVVGLIAARINPLVRVEKIVEDIPALISRPSSLDQTFNDIFENIGGRWIVHNGWAMQPDFLTNFDAALEDSADQNGVSKLAVIGEALGISVELVEEFLMREESASRFIIGDCVAINARSHQDRAVAVLGIHSKPMTVEEIFAECGGGNIRSASNQYSVDPRLTKVSLNKWALAEWGMEEYRTIADWLGRRVDAGAEQVQVEVEDSEASLVSGVKLADLFEEAENLEISEVSIRAYASSFEFQTIDGVVIRRIEAQGEGFASTMDESADMVMRDGEWNYLLEVNSDHLRGSGFSMGKSVANYYGLQPLGEVALESRLGTQYIRMNRLGQVQISTMKRFLEDLGVQPGDRVFLKFGQDMTFDVAHAPARNSGLQGIAAIYDDLGIPLDLLDSASSAEAQLAPINESLGLRPDAPRRRTVAIFNHRRQEQWAEVVQGL
ncbi:exonuclease domain-containing protein [uncultured Corynebacterium sp.]|uniref:exonuclease domain-containing protein n=1 Tax=uncultured Corynebacterium sp. TaxID=159447 RepID=UPI002592826A|nr:exonuclease domain-containing protein [uncultured Corynebacterium sp.]